MADLTPEQDKLNSARDHAYGSAQALRANMDLLIKTLDKGNAPSEALMDAIYDQHCELAEYFALLRQEG